METNSNDSLYNIKRHITLNELGPALREMQNLLHSGQLKGDTDQFASIKEEYDLLCEYWRKGYDDTQRELLYQRMLQRLFTFTSNVELRAHMKGSPYLMSLYQQPRQASRNWSTTLIRKQLEDFVSNAALLELEPDHVRADKEQQLYNDHHKWMSHLFNYIVTSAGWSEAVGNTFIELLSLPTVDVNDQCLIVSAITLSAMNNFDMEKLRVLMRAYQQTADQGVRQRALVGWVLSMNDHYMTLFPQQAAIVKELCDDSRCRDELTELQMQLFYSLMADADSKTIEKDIIPDLIKGNNLKITRNGLEEVEEDQIEEILHPENTELKMEKMEQRLHEMADMQRNGSDIYFAGFKQMKRFPFFADLSNWFMPFYPKHPAIRDIWQKSRNNRFLKSVMNAGAFCDSDKYSFTLAFKDVVGALPPSVVEMIEKGEATATPLGGMVPEEEQQSPAFIRRSYLQDIYRFSRLHPVRTLFRNIFEQRETLTFFSSHLFQDTALQQRFNEMAAFMLKHGHTHEALLVLENADPEKLDYQFYMLYARAARLTDQGTMTPLECYQEALKLRPADTKALKGYARECFVQEMYEPAAETYDKLLETDTDNASLLLAKAACMANMGACEEALKLLYRLDYEHHDDSAVNRTMAWTLTEAHQFEQAEKIYHRLLNSEDARAEDYLNAAYCLWLSGRNGDAINMFRRYRDDFDVEEADLLNELDSEHLRLSRNGISDIGFQLMRDAVSD